jgi:hypothetical protein
LVIHIPGASGQNRNRPVSFATFSPGLGFGAAKSKLPRPIEAGMLIYVMSGPGVGPIRGFARGSFPVIWFYCLVVALGSREQGAAEVTDWMKPPNWTGNFWGPMATRARSAGQIPPLPTNAAMTRWRNWGQKVLRDGDIVFRLGDARTLRGLFPLSRFIARATGSPFSHTGIVAVEGGSPVIYDCSSAGVQRQPFEVWMLDCIGSVGVKRLKPEHRHRIPGVIEYCRLKFEQQVPFAKLHGQIR